MFSVEKQWIRKFLDSSDFIELVLNNSEFLKFEFTPR